MYSGKLKKVLFVINSVKNLMKVSPILDKISRYYDTLEPIIIYTGKLCSRPESSYLYEHLELPKPNLFLNIPPGPQAEATGQVMMETERILDDVSPDLMVVIGGSASGLGASITAARKGIKIAHIESGLRCPGFPSATDINRKLIDSITDLNFVTDCISHGNMLNEGIPEDRIFFVGNLMVDTLKRFLPFARESKIHDKFGLIPKMYAVLSLHRKANTQSYEPLNGILSAAKSISKKITIVFACHKRVKNDISEFGLTHYFDNKRLIMYVETKYPDILALERDALFTMTDSGTMQVESSAMGIPCLTLRQNTEWVATVKEGTNMVVGSFPEKIIASADSILDNKHKPGGIPKYWDGHTAERIVEIISKSLPFDDPSTRKIKTSYIK